MNNDIAAKTIRRKGGKPETTVLRTKLERAPREHRASLAEKIADSPIFIKHWYWPNAIVKFPLNALLRKVDVYFPYAKDSKGITRPLLIDFCETEEEIKIMQPKIKELKKIGLKHIILRPRMTFNDAMIVLGDD